MAGRVVILTAVQMEARAVARALGLRPASAGKPIRGEMAGVEVEMHVVGIGARHLPALDGKSVGCVILAGLAGGLDPSLKVGDVVMECSPRWPDPLPYRHGTIHTTDRIATTPAEKSELFRTTGAAAVDMEQSIVRHWANSAGVPLIAIRAISDSAADSLDPMLLRLVDEFGQPRLLALLSLLLRKPATLPALVRLARDAHRALRALGCAVVNAVRSYASNSARARVC